MESVAQQLREMAKGAGEVEALRLRALAASVDHLEAKLEEMRERAQQAVMAQLNHRCMPTPCGHCADRVA